MDQNFDQYQPERVSPEEFGDFIVKEEVEDSVEEEDHQKVEGDGEDEEV